MKTTLAITIILVAASASAANELTEADFEEFAETGVLDPDMSNIEAIELVQQGISSDQPRVVELTVQAMANAAFTIALNEAAVQRPFHLVPGLKEFLIGYWHDNKLTGTAPTVGIVPMILAVHYPGDEDVHHVVWDYHATGGPDFATLMALNAGRFKTPEADRLRIDSLSSDDFVTFAGGALGLAMSTPRGGAEALVSALKSNPLSADMPATDIAIRAYGSEAVRALRESIEEGGLSPEAEKVVSDGLRDIEDQLGSESGR